MKLIVTYGMTLAAAVGAAYIAAQLAGVWFPHLSTPLFLALAFLLAFLGWRHASQTDRNATLYRTSDVSQPGRTTATNVVSPRGAVIASTSADPLTAFVHALLPDLVFFLRDYADTVHRLLLLGSDEGSAPPTRSEATFRHSVLFALHVLDRRAFRALGPFKRRVFMDAVLLGVAHDLATTGWRNEEVRTDWNTFQGVFSRHSALFPDRGVTSKGTLFWEFAKSVALESAESNPMRIAAVAEGSGYLVEAFDKICEMASRAG
jgi:hypothetical protein